MRFRGTGYRIRVIASNPSTLGSNNGTNLTINELPLPGISGLLDVYCNTAAAVSLNGVPSGGAFTVNGNAATIFDVPNLPASNTVVYTYTDGAGCTNTATKVVAIDAGSPLMITQQGGIMSNVGTPNQLTNACLGTNITLSASTTGNPLDSLKWQRNGLDLLGETNPSLVLNSGWGVYSVAAKNINGCSSISDTFGVSFWGLPNTQAGSDRSICLGTSVTIGAQNVSTYTYSWYPTTGLSNPLISNPVLTLTNPTEKYYVLATVTATGCTKIDSMEANLLTSPLPPTITTTSPTAFIGVGNVPICEGTTVTLTPSNVTGTHLQWLKDNTQITLTTNLSAPITIGNTSGVMATYTAKTKGVNGCFSPASNPVNITIKSAPLPTITPTGVGNIIYLCYNGQPSASQLLTVNVASGSPVYSWHQSGVANPISSDITYLATIDNVKTSKGFSVKAYYPNGCLRTSVGRVVRKDPACREEMPLSPSFSMKVYPNPVSDKLSISLENEKEETATLTLMNPLGQIVWQKNMRLQIGSQEETIDLSDFAKGIYFLDLQTTTQQKTIKVVKE
ncbi:MAG: T9SS type A sorting domain-containing protein [Bacteroidia bacterium]